MFFLLVLWYLTNELRSSKLLQKPLLSKANITRRKKNVTREGCEQRWTVASIPQQCTQTHTHTR